MRRIVLTVCGAALYTLSPALLSAAQITSHVENGRRIYVNAEEAPRPVKPKPARHASVLVRRDARTGQLVSVPPRTSAAGAVPAAAMEAAEPKAAINEAKSADPAPKPDLTAARTAAKEALSPEAAAPAGGSDEHAGSSRVSDTRISEMITATAERHELDEGILRAVIKAESNFNPKAVSYKGAMGLMQLMPGTARDLGVRNAFDPLQNLDGGARYLKSLLSLYEGDLLRSLAAYNAGPGAVQRYNGVPPYRETQQYVRRISSLYRGAPRAKQSDRFGIMKWVDSNGRVHFSNTEGN